MVDAVVKIGGSLIRDGLIEEIIDTLEHLNRDHDFLTVIGGGELADGVRSFDSMYGLSDSKAHWTAIKCMDLNTEMVEDIGSELEVANSVESAKKILDRGRLPLMQSLDFMKRQNQIHSWELTSDSISGLIAEEAKADKLVIVTDVDGIYSEGELMTEIPKEKASKYSGTCIDSHLPKVLEESNIQCEIVSGRYPERIEKALKNQNVVGTRIK